MKRFAISLVLVLAVIASTAAAAQAQTTGYACTYRSTVLPTVSFTLTGSDLEPEFCQVFNHSFKGHAYYGYRGSVACAWASLDLDIRVTINARSSFYGRMFCGVFGRAVDHGKWYRIR